ncbi:MAG: CoA-binding protein [Bacteroidetes bacterium]|nr:CoA-binding protein [Bacteroidota bacterium]
MGNSNILHLLKNSIIIAVVGASPKPGRDSGNIFRYLLNVGYKAYPVNPLYSDLFGYKCFENLTSLSKEVGEIDIVNIFRKSEDVEEVVDESIKVKSKSIWMQLGIINQLAAQKAIDAGLDVVMNKCILVEHRNLF